MDTDASAGRIKIAVSFKAVDDRQGFDRLTARVKFDDRLEDAAVAFIVEVICDEYRQGVGDVSRVRHERREQVLLGLAVLRGRDVLRTHALLPAACGRGRQITPRGVG